VEPALARNLWSDPNQWINEQTLSWMRSRWLTKYFMILSKISKTSFFRPLFSNTFWVPRTDIVSYFPKLCLSMLWKPISANASC
jgi:hypothetical protein